MQFRHAFLGILLTAQLACSHPVIGILTIPSDDDYDQFPKSTYSYFAASYVKFIESGGAQVVPIPYEADEATLDKYFENVNGILFTGGTLEWDLAPGDKYVESVAYLLNKALVENDKGNYFPILGICLGHQTLHFVVSGYKFAVLTALDGLGRVNQPVQIVKQEAVLYKGLSQELVEAAQSQNVVYFYTSGGVLPDFYKTNFPLQQFFDITSVSYDKSGTRFIAGAQAKRYPIFTTQYHPEKSQFEWNVPANHTRIPILWGRGHADAFVAQARLNSHAHDPAKAPLIYNFEPIQLEGASFNQIYFFKLGQLQ